jgi:uncharacterized protein (TIGR00369 family)
MEENNLINKYIETNSFGKLIGMDFKIIEDGIVECCLTIRKDHLATPIAAHGGVVSTLVDSALGLAGLSLVYKENKAVSTVEYKLNFLAPALLGDKLMARGKVEHKGKRIIITSCDVFCQNRENKLLAKALGTFNAYDASRAGY